MRSSALGKSTLGTEVQGITRTGVWVYVSGREYFLSYSDYPWFKDAKVSAVYDLRLLHGRHLYWPELDVDLELESLEHPERYPLRSRERGHTRTSHF